MIFFIKFKEKEKEDANLRIIAHNLIYPNTFNPNQQYHSNMIPTNLQNCESINKSPFFIKL